MFEGTVNESSVEVFCREKNITFGDFVKVKATTEMLYAHPFLFDMWFTE